MTSILSQLHAFAPIWERLSCYLAVEDLQALCKCDKFWQTVTFPRLSASCWLHLPVHDFEERIRSTCAADILLLPQLRRLRLVFQDHGAKRYPRTDMAPKRKRSGKNRKGANNKKRDEYVDLDFSKFAGLTHLVLLGGEKVRLRALPASLVCLDARRSDYVALTEFPNQLRYLAMQRIATTGLPAFPDSLTHLWLYESMKAVHMWRRHAGKLHRQGKRRRIDIGPTESATASDDDIDKNPDASGDTSEDDSRDAENENNEDDNVNQVNPELYAEKYDENGYATSCYPELPLLPPRLQYLHLSECSEYRCPSNFPDTLRVLMAGKLVGNLSALRAILPNLVVYKCSSPWRQLVDCTSLLPNCAVYKTSTFHQWIADPQSLPPNALHATLIVNDSLGNLSDTNLISLRCSGIVRTPILDKLPRTMQAIHLHSYVCPLPRKLPPQLKYFSIGELDCELPLQPRHEDTSDAVDGDCAASFIPPRTLYVDEPVVLNGDYESIDRIQPRPRRQSTHDLPQPPAVLIPGRFDVAGRYVLPETIESVHISFVQASYWIDFASHAYSRLHTVELRGGVHNVAGPFPPTVKNLSLHGGFSKTLLLSHPLPVNLERLQLNPSEKGLLLPERLPDNLRVLIVGACFDAKLREELPRNLRVLVINFSGWRSSYRYAYPHKLPKHLPDSLDTLVLGKCAKKLDPSCPLPPNLRILFLDIDYNGPLPLPLPESLRYMNVGNASSFPATLPNGLRGLLVGEEFQHLITALPRSLSWFGCLNLKLPNLSKLRTLAKQQHCKMDTTAWVVRTHIDPKVARERFSSTVPAYKSFRVRDYVTDEMISTAASALLETHFPVSKQNPLAVDDELHSFYFR